MVAEARTVASAADLIRVVSKVHDRSSELLEGIKTTLDARRVLPTLTAREIEIVECLAQGLRTRAIAATLRLSEHTINMHAKNIYKKLNVHGRAAAVLAAFRRGYVQLGDGRRMFSDKLERKAPDIEQRVEDRRPRQLTA